MEWPKTFNELTGIKKSHYEGHENKFNKADSIHPNISLFL